MHLLCGTPDGRSCLPHSSVILGLTYCTSVPDRNAHNRTETGHRALAHCTVYTKKQRFKTDKYNLESRNPAYLVIAVSERAVPSSLGLVHFLDLNQDDTLLYP